MEYGGNSDVGHQNTRQSRPTATNRSTSLDSHL
jgi:hypothetical protein